MFVQLKTLFAAIAGVVAAISTWLLVDRAAVAMVLSGGGFAGDEGYRLYVTTFGLLLAVWLAAGDAQFRDTSRQRRASLLIGLACGLAGALAGPWLGLAFYSLLPPEYPDTSLSSLSFLLTVLFLAVGWTVTGAAAGAVAGLSRRSKAVALHGALGGALGGLVAGTVFQTSAVLLYNDPESASSWRLCALAMGGLLAGILAVLVPDQKKQTWLTVIGRRGSTSDSAIMGTLSPPASEGGARNEPGWIQDSNSPFPGGERGWGRGVDSRNTAQSRGVGREYIVGRSPFHIGTDPRCDIVLEGDPAVAPRHILIDAIPQTNRYRLRHTARSLSGRARYPATILNDENMTSERWLSDGDVIGIAGTVLEFNDLATRVERRGPEQTAVEAAAVSSKSEESKPEDERTAVPQGPHSGAESLSAAGTPTGKVSSVPMSEDEPTAVSQGPPSGAEADGGDASLSESGTWLGPPPDHDDDRAVVMVISETSRTGIGTRLACIGGPYMGQSFALTHLTASIGRSLEHPIALPADTAVSRTHARIVYENGRHVISDYGSANGIRVNNEPVVGTRPLQAMDIVTIGSTLLRYE